MGSSSALEGEPAHSAEKKEIPPVIQIQGEIATDGGGQERAGNGSDGKGGVDATRMDCSEPGAMEGADAGVGSARGGDREDGLNGAIGEEKDGTQNEGNVVADKPERSKYKKRKVALFFAYIGAGYQGMQRNPGAKTIEGELELALHKAGAITKDNFGDPKKVGCPILFFSADHIVLILNVSIDILTIPHFAVSLRVKRLGSHCNVGFILPRLFAHTTLLARTAYQQVPPHSALP